MNAITIGGFDRKGQPKAISSRDVANVTGKRHDHVMRDIREMLVVLHGEDNLPKFGGIEKDSRNRDQPVFLLPKREALILASGYRIDLRAKIIDLLEEYETGAVSVAKPMPRIDVSRECRLAMGEGRKWAKEMGLTGNQAIIAANRLVNGTTGIDPLMLMGISHIDAPQNEALLCPTEIGKRIGNISGRAVNDILCRLGLQFMFRDSKGKIYYEPTDAGMEAGGVMQDTERRHSSGAPVRQLRWASSVIHIVDGELQREVGE